MHQVGDPLIWEHSASWCRGWGRWRLKLGVTWVGVVGRGTGADSPSPSHGLAYFLCTGPWKLCSGFWLQESVRSRPLLRSESAALVRRGQTVPSVLWGEGSDPSGVGRRLAGCLRAESVSHAFTQEGLAGEAVGVRVPMLEAPVPRF